VQLTGKNVVVTGASTGIGRATAIEMARRGAHLVLAGRRLGQLEETAAPCRALGASVVIVTADVARIDDCRRIIVEAGRVDVLVNNAGFAVFDSIEDADPAGIEAMMQTNYLGMVHCTQAALPQMLARGEGSIVNVASIAGIMGYARMGGYCASKFAVIGFTEALRDEVMGRGVHVGLICPGLVETEFFVRAERRKMPAASRLVPGMKPERVARAICNAAEDGRYRRILPASAALYMRFKEISPRLAHLLMRRVSALME
jgi:short-subunit dehydrogenase